MGMSGGTSPEALAAVISLDRVEEAVGSSQRRNAASL
jgi:hypothetical protein